MTYGRSKGVYRPLNKFSVKNFSGHGSQALVCESVSEPVSEYSTEVSEEPWSAILSTDSGNQETFLITMFSEVILSFLPV